MFASALFEVRDARYVERGTALLRSLRRTHFADGVWWRTETPTGARQRERHRLAARRAASTPSKRPATTSGSTLASDARARTCSSTTGTVTCRRRRSPHVGGGIFSRSDLVTDLHAQSKGDLRRRDAVESRRRVSRARASRAVHR